MQRSIIAPAERVTNLRWAMAAFIGFGVLVTTLDQAGLAVNGGLIGREFGLDDVGLGYLLSAFGWAFAVAQIPFGIVLDRIGVKQTGRGASIAWVIVSALFAVAAKTSGVLMALRLLLGIAQAPVLPAASKATGYWFPAGERSTGTAYFDAPQKLAVAIAIPSMAWVGAAYGWRAMFVITTIAGLLYAIVFFAFYRDPAESSTLTYAEKQHLAQGDAQRDGAPSSINIYAQRKVWGITIGFFAYAFAFFLFVTWLPAYIARVFHMGVFETSASAAIPWLGSAIADVLIGGMIVDAAIKRGGDASAVRKRVLIIGMLLGIAVFGAVSAHEHTAAVLSITVAIIGLGISGPVAWSLPRSSPRADASALLHR